MSTIKIPAEFRPLYVKEGAEVEISVTATNDPVVRSCDLLTIRIPNQGDLTLVIDAELRRANPAVAILLQALFDAVEVA